MNHLAQITNPALTNEVQNLESDNFLSQLISTVITAGLVIGSIVFMFMLLMGGLQWITSGGDKNGLEAARGRILHALVGLIVLFVMFVVISLVETLFNVNILEIDLDPLIIN